MSVKTTTEFKATTRAGLAAAEALAKKLVQQLSDPGIVNAMFAAEFPDQQVGVKGVQQEAANVTIAVSAPPPRKPPPKRAPPPRKPTARKPPPKRAPSGTTRKRAPPRRQG